MILLNKSPESLFEYSGPLMACQEPRENRNVTIADTEIR
jgi:hypothetical protein